MATQQTVPYSLSVVPFPAPNTITQLELTALLSLRGRLHQLETQVEAAEQSIKDRLEKGVVVEEGDHTALLTENSRRNVAWKSVVERELGEDYARRVLAATKPDVYTKLVVE